MIRTQLTTALTAAGCTQILYESAAMANITADEGKQAEVIAMVIEPDTLNLETKGNAVLEHYNPVVVEIMQMVRPEDLAAHNEAALQNLLTICKTFITSLVRSGGFQKIPNVPVTKISEKHYDANVIGWAMALDLIPIINAEHC